MRGGNIKGFGRILIFFFDEIEKEERWNEW
jgi:hypothetical protein